MEKETRRSNSLTVQSPMSAVSEVAGRQWSLDSWKQYKGEQMATYEDTALHASVLAKLTAVPGLVLPSEVDALTESLAAAGRGERFIVQGGDCAERFIDCEPERISAQLALITQMGAIVSSATGRPTVRIARIAGQYGKPRSKPTETVEGFGEIYSFKGDNINGYEPKDRKWDPQRLLDGYWHSAATMNNLRALQMEAESTSALVSALDVSFLKPSSRYDTWSKVAADAKESPQAEGITFTAHEAMQLDLEQVFVFLSLTHFPHMSHPHSSYISASLYDHAEFSPPLFTGAHAVCWEQGGVQPLGAPGVDRRP